jgi:hypothetical protein
VKKTFLWAIVVATLASSSIRAQNSQYAAKEAASAPRLPPHAVLITVDNDVKLEVLDWGAPDHRLFYWQASETLLTFLMISHPNSMRPTMSTE